MWDLLLKCQGSWALHVIIYNIIITLLMLTAPYIQMDSSNAAQVLSKGPVPRRLLAYPECAIF